MNPIPRTFCVTLRETPKRKEESKKYFEQVGLKAEFFDGIHGESFGLKTTIPNYDILPGREYFISPGHVGCILSHFMLWNVLINQPEDEFLIVEDDIQLCEDFFEKFAKFKLELPTDWEMAYVGWIPVGGEENKDPDITYVSDNVIICKPSCTHAYLVKKSALKKLIDTNQLAWNPLDLQIIERTLPNIKYYVSKTPLVTQRSVYNTSDEIWYSLCHDWNVNPEWLGNNKSQSIRMGNGWYPLEKNSGGYMIWSDGRGEIILDNKWSSMEFDFIAEGEIEQKLKIICPNQPEQIIEIKYGQQHISFPINGATSVIIVSDTFRPCDIYKTPDNRRLGIRFLSKITLNDTNGKSTDVSLYSMYGAKKVDDVMKSDGIKMINVKYNYEDGKINLNGQFTFRHHRSGWKYALELLTEYHRDDAIVLDGWLERTFAWQKTQHSQLRLIPYREPWVGVFHIAPNIPSWFGANSTPSIILQSNEFQDSLSTCKGLYVLSKYHEEFLKCFVKNIPVETLYYPTEIPDVKFNFDNFIKNNNKKILNVGWWGRKLSSIYQLEVDSNIYQKLKLHPEMPWVKNSTINTILEIEKSFRKSDLTEDMKKSVIDIRYMPNNEYDELLSKNIVFVDYYDVSASNIIVECIARGTPILINPLPAVVEYLGSEYPFYFNNISDASKKLKNISLIKATHEYLAKNLFLEKVTSDYFKKTIREGNIWKSL